MIIITSVTLTPSTVNVGQSFKVAVSLIEIIIPDEAIRYCGTFYSGQDYSF